jgi:hypothetical protein
MKKVEFFDLYFVLENFSCKIPVSRKMEISACKNFNSQKLMITRFSVYKKNLFIKRFAKILA